MALRHLRALDRRTPAVRKFATAAVAWTVLSGVGFAIHAQDWREALRTLCALRCLGLTGRHREVASAHLRRAIVRTTVKAVYTAIGFDALLNPRPPDYPPPRLLPVAGLILSVVLLDVQSLLDLREQRRTLGRFRDTMLRRAARGHFLAESGADPPGPHGAAGAAPKAAQSAPAESTATTAAVFRTTEPIE